MRIGAMPLPEHLARARCARQSVGDGRRRRSPRWPSSSPTRWPGSIARGTRCTRSSGPVGGALLALAIVDPGDPATQAVAFILGGGGGARGAWRQGRRAGSGQHQPRTVQQYRRLDASRTSRPRALLCAAYEYPYAAGGIAVVLLALTIWLLLLARRVIRRIFGRGESAREH